MNSILKKIYMYPARIYNSLVMKYHKVIFGENVIINGRLRLYGKGNLKLDDNVKINSLYRMNPIGGNGFTSIYIKPGACVEIGEESGLSNVAIYAAKKVSIGKRVKIGGNVKIYDTDFHSVDYKERSSSIDTGIKCKEVHIGDDVFVGAHSIILKGVNIGNKSIIGAGSVVTNNIPEGEIWGGAPAKFIRKQEVNPC